jgi:hypothetical protein
LLTHLKEIRSAVAQIKACAGDEGNQTDASTHRSSGKNSD